MTQLAPLTAESMLTGTPPPLQADRPTVIQPKDRVIKPCLAVAGLAREICVDTEQVWVGVVTAEANKASPWHDHGDYTSYLFVQSGEITVEWGSEGKDSLRLCADGSVYVFPPHWRHREINAGTTPAQALVVRVASAAA